jgi:hypothetical protein
MTGHERRTVRPTGRNAIIAYRNEATGGHHRVALWLRSLKPSKYKLFAWEGIEPGSFLDPGALELFQSRAQMLTLEAPRKRPRGSKSVDRYFAFTGSGARVGNLGGFSLIFFITSATARSNCGSLP